MECLNEANRFLYTSQDVRFAACERALRQVTHMLERLAQVWKVGLVRLGTDADADELEQPVMNPTALYSSLGALVNDVLLRVLEEIEDQADISEEESIRLNKLCKELHGLEALFLGGPVRQPFPSITQLAYEFLAQSSVGREVHIWFKFVFLSELLEASMVRSSSPPPLHRSRRSHAGRHPLPLRQRPPRRFLDAGDLQARSRPLFRLADAEAEPRAYHEGTSAGVAESVRGRR